MPSTDEARRTPPYSAHASIVSVSAGGLTAASGLARALGRDRRRGAEGDGRPPAGARRAPDVQPLHRNVGGGGPRDWQILAPRGGRLLTWTLAAGGANDFLQAAFVALTNKSNEIEQRIS